jgi:hypothetical protein
MEYTHNSRLRSDNRFNFDEAAPRRIVIPSASQSSNMSFPREQILDRRNVPILAIGLPK